VIGIADHALEYEPGVVQSGPVNSPSRDVGRIMSRIDTSAFNELPRSTGRAIAATWQNDRRRIGEPRSWQT